MHGRNRIVSLGSWSISKMESKRCHLEYRAVIKSTARSMTFSSSPKLPGPGIALDIARAGGLREQILRANFCA